MQKDNVSSDILRTCASAKMIGTCLKTYDEFSIVELLLPSARRQSVTHSAFAHNLYSKRLQKVARLKILINTSFFVSISYLIAHSK